MMNGNMIWKLQQDEQSRNKREEFSSTLPAKHSGKILITPLT